MNRNILQLILESRGNKGLTMFDIDETLFRSDARVKVKTGRKVVKLLTNIEFNSYKLKKGEKFDFGEFKSAKRFNQTATPIAKMIAKAKAIIKNAVAKGSDVIFVTARADMDDRELFLDTFRAQGIDIDNVHVVRAGNIGLDSAAKNKEVVFRKYLRDGKYKRMRLFDDHVENLYALLKLRDEFPDVTFEAYRVKKDGSTKKVR